MSRASGSDAKYYQGIIQGYKNVMYLTTDKEKAYQEQLNHLKTHVLFKQAQNFFWGLLSGVISTLGIIYLYIQIKN